jgi:hypothetical protein
LLDVVRISRGKIELRRQQLEFVRPVGDVAKDHRRVLETAGLTLCLELPEEPVWMHGDPTCLAQVRTAASPGAHHASASAIAEGRRMTACQGPNRSFPRPP